MQPYAFRILNVFTVGEARLSGNPLAVFEDARGMTEGDMQALARQLNLSETTFVLPAERGGDARVRIFTPGFEMPFAGHPTLGTASVVARALGKSQLVLEMLAGNVPVDVAGDGGHATLRTARGPVSRSVVATRGELAAMLGLPGEEAIRAEPLWVDTGVEQLVIPIASAELVRAAKPVPALIEQWGYSAARSEAMAYLVAPGPDHVVRFFFTAHGAVLEDPATGSACANLGGWWLETGGALPYRATLRQGDAIHRPSQLELHVDAERAIYVSGSVIELGTGTIEM